MSCYVNFKDRPIKNLPTPVCGGQQRPSGCHYAQCNQSTPLLEIPMAKKCNAGLYMYQGNNPDAVACRDYLSKGGNVYRCALGRNGQNVTFQYNSPSEHFFVNTPPNCPL